jgi:hypothetical protein
MATQSLLAKILATARDRSAAMMRRFLLDTAGDVACNFDSDDDDDDDDEDDDDNILHFDLCQPAAAVMLKNGNHVAPRQIAAQAPPVRQKTRSKYPRKDQKDSLWWRDYLANAPRAELALHPTEDWPVYFAVIFTCLSSCFKNWWSLLGIGGGPHGMTTMFVGLGNRCPIWN